MGSEPTKKLRKNDEKNRNPDQEQGEEERVDEIIDRGANAITSKVHLFG